MYSDVKMWIQLALIAAIHWSLFKCRSQELIKERGSPTHLQQLHLQLILMGKKKKKSLSAALMHSRYSAWGRTWFIFHSCSPGITTLKWIWEHEWAKLQDNYKPQKMFTLQENLMCVNIYVYMDFSQKLCNYHLFPFLM